MSEENTPQEQIKTVLPEAPHAPVLPEASSAAKPVLPQAPAVSAQTPVKPVLPEAPVAAVSPAPAVAATAPKKISFDLPKANAPRAAMAAKAPVQSAPVRVEKPNLVSVAIDFVAAAVAVAFAIMIIIDR